MGSRATITMVSTTASTITTVSIMEDITTTGILVQPLKRNSEKIIRTTITQTRETTKITTRREIVSSQSLPRGLTSGTDSLRTGIKHTLLTEEAAEDEREKEEALLSMNQDLRMEEIRIRMEKICLQDSTRWDLGLLEIETHLH